MTRKNTVIETRGASVLRSPRRCRLQARRSNPAGFSFDFRCGKLHSGFQADALEAPAAAVKIWQPTAVRTFFVGREE